ncbi:Probable galactose dehydrogenase GalD, partial [Geodia barretti]
MTRALSDAVAGDGILVNTICPGLTNTTRARRLHATRAAEEGRDVDELIAEAGRGLPAGRIAEPEECGGIAGPAAAVEDITVEDWDRTVAVNLNSQFYCARRALPALRASGRGALINLSSVAGRLGYAYRSVYAATKWAVVGFTQSLAKELGPDADGIRVNAILPGVVDGERFDSVVVARAAALGRGTAEEVEQEYLSHVSLRRKV